MLGLSKSIHIITCPRDGYMAASPDKEKAEEAMRKHVAYEHRQRQGGQR